MRISEVGDPNNHDVSGDMFAIAAGFELQTPKKGDVLQAGSNFEIRWTCAPPLNIPVVKLEYSSSNGQDWEIIVATTANDGLLDWQVPDKNADQCLIRISATGNPNIFEISQHPFAITTCVNPPATDWDKNCRVDLMDFSMMAAEWLKCGDPTGILCDK